jgi:hypothetical protein
MKDSGYRNRIVENAEKTAYEFSWDTIVGELEETLRRVMVRRSG